MTRCAGGDGGGWRRRTSRAGAERVLVESYPHAAWKALGIKPLPSKRKALVSDLGGGVWGR